MAAEYAGYSAMPREVSPDDVLVLRRVMAMVMARQ